MTRLIAVVAVFCTLGFSQTQLASDSFTRSNGTAPNLLGSNWTLMSPDGGDSTDGGNSFTISSSGNIQSSVAACCSKNMYYGGINWPADQYSQIKLTTIGSAGNGGPSVRTSSNGREYICMTFPPVGAGTTTVKILLDQGQSYTPIAQSTTATVSNGDVVRCQAQGTTISFIDRTTSTTLLSVSDSTLTGGYPGLALTAASGTAWTMQSWSGGAFSTPLVRSQTASDNFQRANSLTLGANWTGTGDNHCNLQIVSNQVQPGPTTDPAGCAYPAKAHYTASSFNNDQWSEAQVVSSGASAAAPDDSGAELRFNGSDNHYLGCDVNSTGAAGTAEVRIVRVDAGTATPLITDSHTVVVSANDFIIGQIQGSLLSCIDATTVTLLATAFDTTYASGAPGWSLAPTNSTPIMTNWSGGNFALPSSGVTPIGTFCGYPFSATTGALCF